MSKLLIYIGENIKFDLDQTKRAISEMRGVRDARAGKFIGAVFECEYEHQGATTIVRISEDAETVTAEGLGDEALDFALNLQSRLPAPLRVIDMDYNFDLLLTDFESSEQLRTAMQN